MEAWLNAPRFARYVQAAGEDRALELYEWNAQVSAAALHDLAHLEIGLRNAYRQAAGTDAPHGKIVAELVFGFWRYLSSAAHEKTLWVPHRAVPRRTDRRRDVDEPVAALNRPRNRAAHHEHLLGEDLTTRHRQLPRARRAPLPPSSISTSSMSRLSPGCSHADPGETCPTC